mmetsp:Transcript_29793/g.102979  ORF Transcript_29793/g.102979 Transcript_29793/m.102979 type:complete len:213 (-) Transcript_29793:12-650(-)
MLRSDSRILAFERASSCAMVSRALQSSRCACDEAAAARGGESSRDFGPKMSSSSSARASSAASARSWSLWCFVASFAPRSASAARSAHVARSLKPADLKSAAAAAGGSPSVSSSSLSSSKTACIIFDPSTESGDSETRDARGLPNDAADRELPSSYDESFCGPSLRSTESRRASPRSASKASPSPRSSRRMSSSKSMTGAPRAACSARSVVE